MKLLLQIVRPALIALALFMVSTSVTSRIANAADVTPALNTAANRVAIEVAQWISG